MYVRFVRACGDVRQRIALVISYTVFSVIFFVPTLTIVVDAQAAKLLDTGDCV